MCFLVRAFCILLAFNFTAHCDIFPECDDVERETFVADLNDCESYIYCDDEESFVSKCEDNQRFNMELGICDNPENVECPSEETTTQQAKTTKIVSSTEPSWSSIISDSPTSSSSTSTPSSTTTNPISSTISFNTPIVCPTPSKPEEIIYLPSSESCLEYFLCFDKTPIPLKCPKDLEFNTLTSSCDWASASNCKIAGTSTISPREQCNGNKSGYFEYSNNCHYYYRCMNGMLTIQECPSGFGWDAKTRMCSSKACRSGN